MTTQEFKEAFKIAESKEDLSQHDIGVFDGFGLQEFETVTVHVKQVARLIRYQAQYMNGGWDADALNEVREFGRRKFIVVGVSM